MSETEAHVKKVGVVGCGLMGSGTAEVCARGGLEVTGVESSDDAAKAGLARLEASLQRAEEKGSRGSQH